MKMSLLGNDIFDVIRVALTAEKKKKKKGTFSSWPHHFKETEKKVGIVTYHTIPPY